MHIGRTVTTVIEEQLCNGCGKCVRVCPSQTIAIKDGKASICGDRSLACDHCAAVCPTNAIRVTATDKNITCFKTFKTNDRWLCHGDYDTASLVQLMRSRRSCRNYTDRPVDPHVLEDLVKIGVTAPSATNCQKWTFTILPDRRNVVALGDRIACFFKKMNQKSKNPWLRWSLKLIGKNRLDWYYREFYNTVEDALQQWEENQTDLLFHGATALVVVGSKRNASCPKEDALLATQNILLGAHCMGLGTCLIGFAVEAMMHDPSIKRFVQIPDDEMICAVIAVGHPEEKYERVAGRKPFVTRFVEDLTIAEKNEKQTD